MALSLTCLVSVAALAQGLLLPAEPSVVKVQTVWSQSAAQPGDELVLAVLVDIQPPWHINADKGQILDVDGFRPIATRIDVVLADDLEAAPAVFSRAEDLPVSFFDGPLKVFGKRATAWVPIKVGANAIGPSLTVRITLTYQACDDSRCLNERTLVLDSPLRLVDADTAVEANQPQLFEAYADQVASSQVLDDQVAFQVFGSAFAFSTGTRAGRLLILLLAALGGFLLNFTPCVLPVIPIKIMALSQAAATRRGCLLSGLAMSLGVVGFWGALGAAVGLISGFTEANQLFLYPAFTIGIGLVIAAMAVAMCGLFALRLPRFVYAINPSHDSLYGSLGFGVMTAVLSTPCTAPFMGTAAAWAVSQPAGVTLLTFCAIGAGMALPYMVLSTWPSWVEAMPRTGPASELIKQLMGLLMLAAATYFIAVGILGLTNDGTVATSQVYWWFVIAPIVAAGLWLAWRSWALTGAWGRRTVFGGTGLIMAAASIWMATAFNVAPESVWNFYTPTRYDEAMAAGRPVLLDFTAEWCLNCKLLEHQVLHDQRVVAAIHQRRVAALKVDLTSRRNVDGHRLLSSVGRVNIPLLVLIAPDGRQIFTSHAYTASQVIDAITAASRTAVPTAESAVAPDAGGT